MEPDIGSESSFFAYPTCIRRPLLRGPRRNITIRFGVEKLEWCGYRWRKKHEGTITRFDRIHERNGQTDKPTDRHRMTAYSRACVASRGKN